MGSETWNETSKKILQQASVEVTHNKRLRDKLQEIGEEGKLDFTACFIISEAFHGSFKQLLNSFNFSLLMLDDHF